MNNSWRMFATRRADGFRHFGPPGFAALGGGAVTEVTLTEDPDGEYWAWIDAGATEPVLVSSGYPEFEALFCLGDTGVGPYAEQEAGIGRVVRLQVRELRLAGAR